jgi:amino acid adenylation domain-containing protein
MTKNEFSTDNVLPLPSRQYKDYVRWQSEMLATPEGERLWAYWEKQLMGELPLLNNPLAEQPNSPVQTYRGDVYLDNLKESTLFKLQKLEKTEKASIFTICLAAFYVLLGRLSGQEEILIGVPMTTGWSGIKECERIIGMLANPVVCRVNLAGNPTFKELIERVCRTLNEAQEYRDYPFPLLVSRLKPHRNHSYSPLLQVCFGWETQSWYEKSDLLGRGSNELRIEPYLLGEQGGGSFDIYLTILEAGGKQQLCWKYSTDLFNGSTIARIASYFQTLLEGIVSNSNQNISKLPLLTAAEQHQLLVEWNNTQTDYSQERCIHQWFEEIVERSPNAVAVDFEGEQLTYLELNQRANQLARYLQTLSLEPEVLVGICVERSLEMIVGILGVLKAGGAYVPLDPTYPQERLAYMLEDARLPVLLSQQRLVERLPASAAKVVCLDSDWETIAAFSQENPVHRVTPDNLAYAIYTSGSTGKPKGVLVAHRGLCNLVEAQIRSFYVQPNSCVLQFASFSFDASVSEIFMALCAGARLAIAPAESLRPGPDLIELFQKQGITHVTLPPSALATLPYQELPTLQTLIVAGEACPKDLAKKWSKGRRFLNAYGPSETTVCATIAEITDIDEKLPIGRPIANTQVYILDRHLQPLPIGVPGELHIGGVGLAKGYLNRPDLTEQKFIPNPFVNFGLPILDIGLGNTSEQPEVIESQEHALNLKSKIQNPKSERLYKTGDLARYLPDGNIEFLGRIDNLVKIRGFRIELGEIEAVLRQHPGVGEAVVIDREDIPGNKRLVAYLVCHQEQPALRELGNFLKTKLPDYMVPSAFVFLPAIPLTPNGKINRHALPAPAGLRPELETAYVNPETETEAMIAAVWQEALGLKKVGIHDNFFELGGHSLLIAQIYSKFLEILGQQLSIVELFQYPTIQTLANHLSQKKNPQPDSPSSHKRASIRRALQAESEQLRQRRQKHRSS